MAAAERRFEFSYEAVIRDVPASARTAYLWIPYPPDNEDQTLRNLEIISSLTHELVEEEDYGNRAVRFELPPGTASERVLLRFQVARSERVRRPDTETAPTAPASQLALQKWLKPDRRVPIDGQIKRWAEETVAGRTTAVEKARAIYDYAVTNLRYDKTGSGWGNGDIYWACDEKRGNCTDFHALVVGFNRAVGVPARFEIGFPIPSERGQGAIGGYHCWAQFYLQGFGWVPVDASEANKRPARREYFFGALDANRVMFTVGRDLTLPGMQGEPLNYFIYPYAEVDGSPHAGIERRFSFRDLPARASQPRDR